MKRFSLIAAALLLSEALLLAQTGREADRDFFIGVAGGINMGLDTRKFESREASHIGAGTDIDIYVGKWLGKVVGVRLGYQGFATSNHYVNYNGTPYHYVHADAMFRLGRSFVPYVHAGYLKMTRSTAAGGIGIMAPVWLNPYVSIVPDLKMTVVGAGAFAGIQMPGVNFSASLGIHTRLDHNWKFFQEKDLWAEGRHWFAGIGAGVNIGLDFGPMMSRGLSHAGAGTAFDLYAGRWVSSRVGVRAGYQGFTTSNHFTNYGKELFNYIHADVLWRINSSLIPYAHTGYLKLAHGSLAGGVGLMAPILISDGIRIVPDVRLSIFNDRAFSDGSNGLGGNLSATLAVMANLDQIVQSKESTTATRFAISTNVMNFLTNSSISVDFAMSVARHITLHLGGNSNPWNIHYEADGQAYRHVQWTAWTGMRWWPWYTYSGWWVGARAQWANYIGKGLLKNNTFEGNNALGLGIQAGYTLMLSKHFNLDIGLGGWGGLILDRTIYSTQEKTTTHPGGKVWFIAPEMLNLSLAYVF